LGKAPEGRNPGEQRPGVHVRFSGASSGSCVGVARTDSRREQSSEAGDPASCRRARRLGSIVRGISRGNSSSDPGGLGLRGKPCSRPPCRAVGPHGSAARLGWRRSVESDRDTPGTSRRTRSTSNPQGSTKAAARRYGSPGGESSVGRIPWALRHETRPQSSGASAVEGGHGKPGLLEATRLNPPRG